jgi:hypothetical protein
MDDDFGEIVEDGRDLLWPEDVSLDALAEVDEDELDPAERGDAEAVYWLRRGMDREE